MSGSGNFLSEIGKRVSIGHHYYIIEKVIAEGGYGVVFLVRDGFGKKFALKRLYVNDETRLKESRSEMDILKMLSGYKNVIKYIDSCINRLPNGVAEVLILTEYYPVTCTQIHEERGVFSEGEIIRIFCDMCEALAVLHHCQKPIIHRDMKIENILLDRHDNYVLCDFGSATTASYLKGQQSVSIRQLEDDFNKHTTPSHRSPEIVDFYSNQSINTKVDIWALGVTLYRLCFNQLPFGESTLAVQSGHITIPDNSRYSDSLHSLIYYCLEVDPDKRPDIFQVGSVAFGILGRQCAINTNLNNAAVPSITQLIDIMNTRRSQATQRAPSPRPLVSSSDWVETTTVRPRERPKAGKHLQIHQQQQPQQPPKQQRQQPQVINSTTASDYYHRPTQNHHVGGQGSFVPVADILDLTSSSQASMTRSLDSSAPGHAPGHVRTHSASPFGDDFSRFDPLLIHQTVGASSTPAGLNNTRPVKTNLNQFGFEDSFADLDLGLSAPRQQSLTPSHTAVESRMGHRRYKSDGAPMVNSARQQASARPTSSAALSRGVSTNVSQLVDIGLPVNPPVKQSSPFGDDFSNYTPTDISSINQHNTGPVFQPNNSSAKKNEVDAFGSIPFSTVSNQAGNHHHHDGHSHTGYGFDSFGGGSISCGQ